ncbi:Serine/threonine-protein kinase, putative [Trichomonas vaginalis G3]|uniref:non-specific serine/threonine protein kinase n=1 Tax=Trichomonas vaginalis (strain ATCC PRA-98 / G3) TaxID=412133 RepID=A2FNI4_TRIV3|nr:protein serine/threonine kinase protein [Trichomonas vaginalis G3]EAX93522.1 Serine/threonine-protein kinase, putative [Trichomonas vaginalis G3]KAI5512276.1 protein serine/threonine kinase protein [Trichomonas vaginalis G3]|eukprot:XP_001306452.1 Serine/threonine-protein kinase [Trichomonas vaginalis G3]
MTETENLVPEGPVTIQGTLKHKGRVIGIWTSLNYWLIGSKLYVSKTDKLSEYYKIIEITPDTNIILVDRKNNTHFIIENEELGRYLLKSNAAEVYPWVFALRACLYAEHGYSMDQFRIISVLGRGFYGKVMLVEKLDTGKLYALKTVQKKKLVECGQVDTIISERNLLFSIPPHPFIVSAEFAFQTKSKFYIGLIYIIYRTYQLFLSTTPVSTLQKSSWHYNISMKIT